MGRDQKHTVLLPLACPIIVRYKDIGYDIGYDIMSDIVESMLMYLLISVPETMTVNVKRVASCLCSSNEQLALPLECELEGGII